MAYAAINGQTGKMTADIPIARVRYLAGVAIVAALLWIILQTFNISSLRGTVLATVFGAMAGGLVYGMIVHKLDENEQNRLWEERMRERMRERNAKASGQAPDPEDKEKKSKKKKNQLPVQKASGAVGVRAIHSNHSPACCGTCTGITTGNRKTGKHASDNSARRNNAACHCFARRNGYCACCKQAAHNITTENS